MQQVQGKRRYEDLRILGFDLPNEEGLQAEPPGAFLERPIDRVEETYDDVAFDQRVLAGMALEPLRKVPAKDLELGLQHARILLRIAHGGRPGARQGGPAQTFQYHPFRSKSRITPYQKSTVSTAHACDASVGSPIHPSAPR